MVYKIGHLENDVKQLIYKTIKGNSFPESSINELHHIIIDDSVEWDEEVYYQKHIEEYGEGNLLDLLKEKNIPLVWNISEVSDESDEFLQSIGANFNSARIENSCLIFSNEFSNHFKLTHTYCEDNSILKPKKEKIMFKIGDTVRFKNNHELVSQFAGQSMEKEYNEIKNKNLVIEKIDKSNQVRFKDHAYWWKIDDLELITEFSQFRDIEITFDQYVKAIEQDIICYDWREAVQEHCPNLLVDLKGILPASFWEEVYTTNPNKIAVIEEILDQPIKLDLPEKGSLVFVRDNEDEMWKAAYFSYYNNDNKNYVVTFEDNFTPWKYMVTELPVKE